MLYPQSQTDLTFVMPVATDDPTPGQTFNWHASAVFGLNPMCGNPDGEEVVSVTPDLDEVDCPHCCRLLGR